MKKKQAYHHQLKSEFRIRYGKIIYEKLNSRCGKYHLQNIIYKLARLHRFCQLDSLTLNNQFY